MTDHSRRNWLKSSALFAAGIATAPLALRAHSPSRNTYKSIRTIAEDLVVPPHMPELRARLLANENPFGPSEKAREAILEASSRGNRYPMFEGQKLLEQIANKEQVSIAQLLMGPGSTQLLDMAASILVGAGTMLTADPSYMAMVETIENVGGTNLTVPLTEDGQHDLSAMLEALDDSISMVYICNPNNPTGTITESENLRNFCRRASEKVPVFVDEAYLDFLDDSQDHSMASLVREGHNVIVARTFSKIYGLAGMRIGYLIGLEDTLDSLHNHAHVEWGLSSASIAAAMASLGDSEFVERCRTQNSEARSFVYELLDSKDYSYMPSSTNFVLFPIRMRPDQFRQSMMNQGVGIRTFEINRRPYCRVSMGTMEEMEIFAQAFEEVVG